MEIRNIKPITSTTLMREEDINNTDIMKYVRTFDLGNDVEVVAKKVIVNEKYWGISMQFITEIDDNLIHMGITGEYNFKVRRDKAFEELDEEALKVIAKTLPTFQNLI